MASQQATRYEMAHLMKILIAAHGFPPLQAAGAERRAERMARWLVANHHEVEVFAAGKLDEPPFGLNTTWQDGFFVHRLDFPVQQTEDPFRNLYENPHVGDAFRQVLAQGSFDLVHLVSGYLLGGQIIHTAHEVGVPVVVTLTEYWFICPRLNLTHFDGTLCEEPESDMGCGHCMMEDQRRYRLPAQLLGPLADSFWSTVSHTADAKQWEQAITQRRATMRAALAAADLVIAPSHYLINMFKVFGFDTDSYLFIRQGLELPAAMPSPAPRAPADPLRLGYSGQIKPHKGVDLVTDAVRVLIDDGLALSLDIWGSGDGDYQAQLIEQTAPYPAIRWNGRFEGAQVWEVLANLDVLVVPSRWIENSPTVILEAYAMGLPVIVTDLGGMAELAEHGKSGLVFELDNADDLRQQIKRLLTEPDLLPQLRAGVPVIKSVADEMHDIVGHYEQVLATWQDTASLAGE